MTIKEFFRSPLIKLPIEQKSNSKSFRNSLFELLDNYMTQINELDLSGITAEIHSAEKIRVQNLTDGIKKSIDCYLDGHPSLAYEELKKSLEANSIFSYLQKDSYEHNNKFYRLRENEANFSMSKGELFHIPFQKRDKVSTQRYSISGFPCLYISDSVYVAWEELRRPSLNNIQAILLVNQMPINFLDLTTDIYLGDEKALDSKNLDELWAHLIAFPIIVACSIKVLNRDASFKPEYIIPQLLLQIIRIDGKLDGIRFSSTHINRGKINVGGNFTNLVIPVKEPNDEGYCKNLAAKFKMTEPVPWEIIEVFSKLHGTFFDDGPNHKSEVSFLELIEGQKIHYAFSTFGKLEEALNEMSLNYIS